MKKIKYLLSKLVIAGIVVSSCSEQYDDDLCDVSLDINSQICRTRSNSGDPDDDPQITYPKNGCGIWVIMSMIGSINSNYFYGKVMDCAESLGWVPNSEGGLTSEQIISICNLLKADPTISNNKDIVNLPSQWKTDKEAQDQLIEIRENHGKKKIQDVSIGVQIEVEVEDPDTGKPVKTLVDHWVVAQYINGNQIYVKNGYRDKYGTKNKFYISEVRAIVY